MRKTLSLGESIRGSRAMASPQFAQATAVVCFVATANTSAVVAQAFSVKAHPSRVNQTGTSAAPKGRPAPARGRLTSRMVSVDVSDALDVQSGPAVKFAYIWAKSPLVIECGPAGQRCIALRAREGSAEIHAGLTDNEGMGAQRVRWVTLFSIINTPGFWAWRNQHAWSSQRTC